MMKNLLEKIKTALVPEFRGIAIAASFEQFFNATQTLDEGSLCAALRVLAAAKGENEPIGTVKRRETCAEIASLCEEQNGSIETAIIAWGNFVNVLANQSETCPPDAQGRILGMLATAKREFAELQNAA